jgi:hypothetical protein
MQNDGASIRLYRITPKEGKLHISAGGNEADLSPRPEPDIFAGTSGDIFIFGHDGDQKVRILELKVQGMTFKGTRITGYSGFLMKVGGLGNS